MVMRNLYPKPEWWTIDNIQQAAARYGTTLRKERWLRNSTLESLWYGEYLILHVDGVHFITVFRRNDAELTVVEHTGLEVWDTNAGIYTSTPALLKNRVTFHTVLKGKLR
jgi:hypothetical protein